MVSSTVVIVNPTLRCPCSRMPWRWHIAVHAEANSDVGDALTMRSRAATPLNEIDGEQSFTWRTRCRARRYFATRCQDLMTASLAAKSVASCRAAR